MKKRINRWVFGYKGLMPEYEKGEKWLVVVGTLMLLAGLGLTIYWGVVVLTGGDVQWTHLMVCVVLSGCGGLIIFSQMLNAFARELTKKRNERPNESPVDSLLKVTLKPCPICGGRTFRFLGRRTQLYKGKEVVVQKKYMCTNCQTEVD